jgi:hypothetical protein
MRIKEIEHVQLAMPPGKESEARNFYEGVLGIPEVPKPPNLAKRGGCWFVRDTLKIHLGVENEFRAARKAHPALLVEDLPALKTLIQAAGYSFNMDEPLAGCGKIVWSSNFCPGFRHFRVLSGFSRCFSRCRAPHVGFQRRSETLRPELTARER